MLLPVHPIQEEKTTGRPTNYSENGPDMDEVKQVFGDLNSPSNGYGSLNVSDSDSDMPNQENNKKGICS